jgi:hypothetical protein
MLQLVCRYQQTVATPTWQVLERPGAPRCGTARFEPTIRFRANETVPVPRGTGREIVVVWLHFDESLVDRIRSTLFKPGSPILVMAGGSEFRIASAGVGGPLLLRIPDAVGWARQFGGGLDYDALRVNRNGRATFAVVPLT